MVSSVSSPALRLSRASFACTRTSRIQTISTSIGPSVHAVALRGKGLGLRTKECDFESVVGQVHTGGGRQEVYRGKMGGFNLPLYWSKAVAHSRSIFPSHCSVSGAASPPQLAARPGSRSSGSRSRASVHKRRSWCGRSRGKPGERA